MREKVLHFFRMEMKGNEEKREFSFAQYMECSRSRDSEAKILSFIILRWKTDTNFDQTLAESCFSSTKSSPSPG